MLNIKTFASLAVSFLVSTMLISTAAFASGGHYSSDSSSSASSSGSYSSDSSKKNVDEAYEYGKSVFTGRSSANVIKYCVYQGENSVQVRASTLKHLENSSYEKLTTSLHNCANPKQLMSQLLDGYQLNSVAYYLNERYKLNLKAS